MKLCLLSLIINFPIFSQSFFKEDCEYKLTYLSIPAVTIRMKVPEIETISGKPCYRIIAHAQTTGLFSTFYSLENTYTTWIDTTTGLPLKYSKSIQQKTIKQTMDVSYDPEKSTAEYVGGKFDSSFTISVSPEVHNLFSIIYKLRLIQLAIGDTFRFNLDIETEPWQVFIKVLKREKIFAGGEEHFAHKLEFQFVPVGEEKKRKHTDILTRRLVNSKTRLFFWLDTERPYKFLQIEQAISPFSTYTLLTGCP